MSALTDRIAAEHRHIPGTHLPDRCSCGWEADDGTAGTWQQHFAQATEAAVRERVARDIEAQIEDAILYAEDAAFVVAARIARGSAGGG